MKKIVIMGATSGIGLALARRLLSQGMRIGIAGRNEEKLRGLQSEFPGQVVYSRIDVTEESAPTHLHDLISRLGGMDVYVHVSGIGYSNPAVDRSRELSTVNTNVGGFTRMIDTAFTYFRDRCEGRGHIVAVTSVAGTNGLAELASYSASKKYQQTYLRALDQLARMQKLSIRFSDIRPGWIRTPLLRDDADYPMLMTADSAAAAMERAISRQKRVSVIDWRWNIVVGLWRLVPNWLWVRLPVKVGI